MDFQFRPIDRWPSEHKAAVAVRSLFRAPYTDTMELLRREIEMLDGRHPVVMLDLGESEIRRDGLPRAGARPRSPGVIVAFESKYGPLKYLCDRFTEWQDNLRAIALGLEALRRVDRYGITKRGEQYTGWKALPPGDGFSDAEAAARFVSEHSGVPVTTILGARESAVSAWRLAAKRLHPDGGGDADAFRRLQRARELLGV